ncbi:MAG: hypothetical protein LC637_08695, partial [Xanthomonadaceae bacterium]|nr:hypothetical protein [Xanthomonadaceae bacterium]
MSRQHAVIVSESPPLTPSAPASGLAVRHTRMAEALACRGVDVTYVWPASVGERKVTENRPYASVPLRSPAELEQRLRQDPPSVVVLGYWELSAWLPARLPAPLVLDYIAPRIVESAFEDDDRLAADVERLVPLLSRCDQVWVGNRPQHDLMLSWMILAGHDCRFHSPIRIVPIAGRVTDDFAQNTVAGRLSVFYGGRDWPWRNSARWLEPLKSSNTAGWLLIDAAGPPPEACGDTGALLGFDDYLARLSGADVALELADDNVERRFSQSFRMTDALCLGVPVICNGFLPLAEQLARFEAGWVIDTPGQLPALLESIDADRVELRRRAANALELARAQLDSDKVYGGLAAELGRLIEQQAYSPSRRPLLDNRSPKPAEPGLARAAARYLS